MSRWRSRSPRWWTRSASALLPTLWPHAALSAAARSAPVCRFELLALDQGSADQLPLCPVEGGRGPWFPGPPLARRCPWWPGPP
uniref:Putative secreted protein n=1 Tax=Ixodes ricinus TaxID=34613 RepID=A0A6B0UA09_IXORI